MLILISPEKRPPTVELCKSDGEHLSTSAENPPKVITQILALSSPSDTLLPSSRALSFPVPPFLKISLSI